MHSLTFDVAPNVAAQLRAQAQRELDRLEVFKPLQGHPMICGERLPSMVPGEHVHVCGHPVRRPDQTKGLPEHKCRSCTVTWIVADGTAIG